MLRHYRTLKSRYLSLPGLFALAKRAQPIALVWLDAICVSVLSLLLIRSIRLLDYGLTEIWQIPLLCAVLFAYLFFINRFLPWNPERSPGRPWVHGGVILAFSLLIALLVPLDSIGRSIGLIGADREMITEAAWLTMFIPTAPFSFLMLFAPMSLLIGLAMRSPQSRFLRIFPFALLLLVIAQVLATYAPFELFLLSPKPPVIPQALFMPALLVFGLVPLLFAGLMNFGLFPSAFRLGPCLFHLVFFLFVTVGVVPVQSVYDPFPVKTEKGPATKMIPGVTVFYPPYGTTADDSFLFLDRMVLADRTLFLSYGPACGLYAIDLRTRGAQSLPLSGPLSDYHMAPDNRAVWGIDENSGSLLVADRDPFSVQCTVNLQSARLGRPTRLLVDGDIVYASGPDRPTLSRFVRSGPQDPCSLAENGTVDLSGAGALKVFGGAFFLHLDRAQNKLYALVDLKNSRRRMGLLEIDLQSLALERTALLPKGPRMAVAKGRDHVLIPTTYSGKVIEFSLSEMRVVRTIHAAPRISEIKHDKKRGLFYALCEASGKLLVINDDQGQVVRAIPVGLKARPMEYDETGDRLFVGSRLGILEIDLKTFLGERAGFGAGG